MWLKKDTEASSFNKVIWNNYLYHQINRKTKSWHCQKYFLTHLLHLQQAFKNDLEAIKSRKNQHTHSRTNL